MVNISYDNIKIGKTMNVSLPPVRTCRKGAPCAKKCYALKAYKGYGKTTCKPAWDGNLRAYRRNPYSYMHEIITAVQSKRPEFFRWHCSGDIVDVEYLSMMCIVAISNPSTKFLAFTKQFELVNEFLSLHRMPSNLSIVFSGWPGLDIPNPHRLPIAYMQDDSETRITDEDLHCPGHCDTCGACWDLHKTGRNVWFTAH